MTSNNIYLDYAATTPVDPRVIEKMSLSLAMEQGLFANSGSKHVLGEKANEAIEDARSWVAKLMGAVPRNIIFTSGATESINLAIKGLALYASGSAKHIVTSRSEHPAVLETCQYLETQGFSVTYLNPQKNGLIDIDQLKSALRTDTILVSIMQVNNETGVIQDIKSIGQLTREKGIFLHVDAAQSLGKFTVDVQDLNVDLLSMTAHKIYGPKGIGALYVGDSPRVRLISQMHGGSQERKFRAGTLATHQIVAFGEACRILLLQQSNDNSRIQSLKDLLWQGLQDLPEVYLNSDLNNTVSHIINIRFERDLKGDFLEVLSKAGIAASAASACHAIRIEPSHVLQAMGYTKEQAKRSIRFSMGRFSTQDDIQNAIVIIRKHYLKLGEKR